MFSGLTYFFDHSIYFARLCHVNPLCKHEYAFLQMKEAPNQKVQEKKPLSKFKNTNKYMCLERIWTRKCFWACRQRPLLFNFIRKLPLSKLNNPLCCPHLLENQYKFAETKTNFSTNTIPRHTTGNFVMKLAPILSTLQSLT